MTPERWQAVKALLDGCAEIAPEERGAWLEAHCDGDVALRRDVESYLAYEDHLTTFDATSPAEPLIAAALDSVGVDEGRQIGPYRLDELLGRGGMGAVYKAHREADFEQQVAVKLVRDGFENPATVQRFQTERQILARLEHPNIARLLDGGTTDDGRPYFVMELIDGLPIDTYCDAHGLSIRQRIELILPLCDALRYAHRNLVLHLDLKPSNIMVTHDGVPKLLDFGIGKLLGKDRETRGQDGVNDSRPMTLGYASPEQLLDEPLTTVSDQYSFGVVLYELFTGRLPCGTNHHEQVTRIWSICHEIPHPPSVAVARREVVGFGNDRHELIPEAVAATRERSVSVLRRRLRGDLDAIVLEALAKSATDRYPSIDQLATDLRRHLDVMPVVARRGDLPYRVGKYARRNRWPLGAITVVLGLILGFTAALSNQLQHTERQRARSERLSEFMVDLFRAAEPDRAGRDPSVRELVDLGRQRLESELADEPEARALLLGTLGQVYYRLGHYDEAVTTLHDSIDALVDEGEGDHPQIAEMWNTLSAVAFARGDWMAAEGYTRQSIAMRERLGADDDLIKPRNNLAAYLVAQGKLDEAAAIYHESLDRRREMLGERHANVALSLRSLGNVLYLAGDFDAAEGYFVESLDIRLEAHGRESESVARALASLARLAHARGELDRAERLFLEALDLRRRLLGPDHLSVAVTERDYAKVLVDRGAFETASPLLASAWETITRHKPEGDPTRADLESLYGAYLAATGRTAEAEICLVAGVRDLEATRGREVWPTREARRRLDAFRAIERP